MTNPKPDEWRKADDYRPGDRIQSNLTRRIGTVQAWPENQPRPPNETSLYGAVWIRWDTGRFSFAWRHQIHRL